MNINTVKIFKSNNSKNKLLSRKITEKRSVFVPNATDLFNKCKNFCFI